MADTVHIETQPQSEFSIREEIAHAITHGVGAVLSIVALVVLVAFSSTSGDPYRIVSVAVFGTTLVILYAASTIYHAVPHPTAKRVLRILDHVAIYLLIAGTYTPFVLVTLRGAMGWTLFGIVWGLALAGIIYKLFLTGRFPAISMIVYLAMGWLGVVAAKSAYDALQWSGMAWLVAGGLAYTLGTLFYGMKRIPYNHAIWHVFVIVGSACHFVCVLFFVAMAD